MPNKAFAAKKDRQQKKRRIHNRNIKSTIRTTFKKIQVMAKDGASEEELQKQYNTYQKMCDKAVSKNIYHQNTVARKKKRAAKIIKKD